MDEIRSPIVPRKIELDDIPVLNTASDKSSILGQVDMYLGPKEYTLNDLRHKGTKFWFLLQNFFKAAVMRSKDNDAMIRLYFHAIMGAYLKNYTIIKGGGATDLRTPIIWIQDSSSGKSQLNKFGVDVARRLGMKATETTEFTNAGMIGTFDKSAHEFNVRHGLKPGEVKEVKKKGGQIQTIKYKDPVIYGDLYYHDILFIDEGKILFQKGHYTENILSILQPALDYPGKVRKKLSADIPIEYDASCTLVISTVEFSELNNELMLQGFFPRCLFYMRKINFRNYVKMHKMLSSSLFNEKKYAEYINNLVKVMLEIPWTAISRERRKIVVDNAVLGMIDAAVSTWFTSASRKLRGEEARIIAAFISRMHTFIYKIAGQMAVLNDHVHKMDRERPIYIVAEEEVAYALDVLNPLFSRLLHGFGIIESPHDRLLNRIFAKLEPIFIKEVDKTLGHDILVEYIKKIAHVNSSIARKHLDELVRANYLIREERMDMDGKIKITYTIN